MQVFEIISVENDKGALGLEVRIHLNMWLRAQLSVDIDVRKIITVIIHFEKFTAICFKISTSYPKADTLDFG